MFTDPARTPLRRSFAKRSSLNSKCYRSRTLRQCVHRLINVLLSFQVCEQKERDKRDSLKSWAEKSVWSLVCAMELGLISEPSLTSVPFGAFPSDGLVSKKFPSINSPIDFANRSPREAALRFAAKMSAQSSKEPSRGSSGRGRRRSRKSGSAERNVCASWDREFDRARNTTVESFWKSRKRRVGRPKGAGRKTGRELDSEAERTDGNRFFDESQSAEFSAGIGYQTCPTSDPPQERKKVSSRFQGRNALSRVSARALHPNGGGRLVSKGRPRRKKGRKTVKIVENGNTDASSVLMSRKRNAVSILTGAKKKAFVDDCWEYSENDRYYPNSDSSMINDRINRYFGSASVDHESANEIEALNGSEARFEDGESNPRSLPGSLEHEDEIPALNDVDTLPLAQRIPNESERSTEREQNCSLGGVAGSECGKYLETSSNEPNDCHSISTIRGTSDVDFDKHEEPLISVERHRRRTKTDCLPASNITEKSSDDDSRCRSPEKQPSPAKRNKISWNGSAVGASAKDAVKTDALRGKLFGNDDQCHGIRMVTRGSRKISKENFVGKLVWGSCSGWWPGKKPENCFFSLFLVGRYRPTKRILLIIGKLAMVEFY